MWLLILAQNMVNIFNPKIGLFFFPRHQISTKILAKSWYTVSSFYPKVDKVQVGNDRVERDRVDRTKTPKTKGQSQRKLTKTIDPKHGEDD